jgi:tight adherence protein C
MLWAVTGVTFVLTIMVVISLVYAFSRGGTEVAGRLSQVMAPPPVVRGEKFSEKQKERVREGLAFLGKLLPAAAGKQATRAQLMMIRAGYRSADAMLVIRGVKLLLPIALILLVFSTGLYRYNPFFIVVAAAAAGFLLPEMWLLSRIKARKRRLRLGLPDGLDLLVICVEVGLGLDQAILRVSQELRIVHPELSEELQLVNLEMRVGKTRIEALRDLSWRTGLDDLKTLVAMLIQTERFGTSVAQSLRVHSDELRTRRRQRAEEMSAKTTVKMVGPLVFLIFPALMAVLLGPAVISLVRQLFPALK